MPGDRHEARGTRNVPLTPHPSPLSPSLVFSPHPLLPARGRELVYDELLPGERLGEYLERSGIWKRVIGRHVLVTIDGVPVPREWWWRCRPKPGTLIGVQALVADDDKNPIGIILTIALLAAAPGLGAAGAKALGFAKVGFAANLLTAGISIAGAIAINALFPPPVPELAQPVPESSTYSLSGGQNRLRPYEPLPVVMGTHRMFPDFGALPYTEFQGDDQFAYFVFDYGYNDVELSDHKVGNTPLADFEDVEIEESDSTGVLSLFPANVDTLDVGVDLELDAGFTQRTSSPDATRLAVDIVGALFCVSRVTGDVINAHIELTIQYRAVGSGTWLDFFSTGSTVEIQNADRQPLRKSYSRSVAKGQYEVQVQWTRSFGQEISAGGDPNREEVEELNWSVLRSYQPDTADYTGRKRVALRIRASGQLNGVLDQFSSITKARTEAWDGAGWVTQTTSNPAWWVLKALRGHSISSRRRWGGGIADARIDLENLKDFGAWCDAEGLTFNAVFDRQMSVLEMLDTIALRGRGTMTNAAGKHAVVWDEPDLPSVAVVGMANIVRDSFEIAYLSTGLADEVVASFVNPDKDWQRDTVRVLEPGVTTPLRSTDIELFGCTDVDEAARSANLYIATNLYRTRRYSWRMDWEAMPLSRGEVANFSHDLASFDYSGRLIEGCTASVLKLDRTVPLNAAGAFVMLVKPDQTFATYAVQAGAGDSNTLNLVSALAFDPGADPGHPPYDYRWLYGHTSTPGRKVKIEAIKPVAYNEVEITALDEDPAYYAAESGAFEIPPAPIFGRPEMSNLDISVDGVRVGSGYMALVILTWDAEGDYAYADVRASVNGGPMKLVAQELRGRRVDFTVPDGSTVTVEVIGYSNMGRLGSSAKITATETVDFAGLNPPGNVTGFTLAGRTFSWIERTEVDIVGYQIRFHYGNRTSWGDANRLHEGLLTGSPYTADELPADVVTFLIKAVDAAKLVSAQAGSLLADLRDFTPEGDELVANVLAITDLEAAGFPGTITGGAVFGGDILADALDSFYDANGDAPLYGPDLDSFYGAGEYGPLTYQSQAVAVSQALVGSRMTLAATIEGSPIAIDYRPMGPGPLYGADDDSLYGPDADPFYDAPPDFKTWLGGLDVANDEYEFKISIGGGELRPAIRTFAVTIDAPDIVEFLDDIAITAGGSRLPIARDYISIDNVQVTRQQDAGTATQLEVVDKDPVNGPLIIARNSAGTSVDATVDATVQGY